ncbi:DegT/DnrJ/EryC1/StrS family aminotransferase [Picosynechococcus sp. PCC 73109]|uniref:DegT/DnrJ/EryC1/StrS family aminotransferase n=1 Tax=Picosynechococcus sp. PCC 73109 TaxID=374982 RepID=UPI0007459413|nr:DegT/DnrJ/EryC1/StrS family aminotransferase [Picosynechococcus sp. PCC 73109]AMA09602.1 Cys/Met metabolism pyridoxal-phosphate-dependent enzyme [Picosynechococcus sp. PCC 73109]
MSQIPPVDLGRQYATIADETNAAVLEVLSSGRYIGGTAVSEFEKHFAAYHQVDSAIGCNSGTDALYLALKALGIGVGDEVITSTFTFIATAEAIAMCGATPVFVDITAATFNLDLDQLEAAITSRTKAVIPVHLFGQPVDMTRLGEIAQKHSLLIVEDCAQATGAKWGDRQVGAWGDAGCFSFFPTKNLGGCGDGGAVTTNNPDLHGQIKMLREHGSKVRYQHEVLGVNSRLDAVQATILAVKLRHLDLWNQQRQVIAHRYHELLAGIEGIQLPQATPGGTHVWNQYTILVQAGDRDTLRSQLQAEGIIAMVYYPKPLHLQPVFATFGYQSGAFPIAEQCSHQVLSLPMFPDLSIPEQEQVATTLKRLLAA